VREQVEFDRPAEVDLLVGDATKAREKLGWEPTVSFPRLVRMMVDADIASLVRNDFHPRSLNGVHASQNAPHPSPPLQREGAITG